MIGKLHIKAMLNSKKKKKKFAVKGQIQKRVSVYSLDFYMRQSMVLCQKRMARCSNGLKSVHLDK